jgi:hypothetical protein
MVTNYPQQLTAAAVVGRETFVALVGRAVTRLGQLLCGIGGHDKLVHYEGKRVMMRCTACGHDSHGWEIAERGPRLRFEGDARRHALAKPRLVVRKSA